VGTLDLLTAQHISTLPPLNTNQQSAVRYTGGPLLVLAGAGSGKTSVITRKIAYLVRERGIAPANIIAVTFTNKAAREMKTRVGDLLRDAHSEGLTVSTFHALGLRILRDHLAATGLRPGFSIYNSDDCESVLVRLVRAAFPGRERFAPAIHGAISRWKNALIGAEQAAERSPQNEIEEMASALYLPYQTHLNAYNSLDFDDLIFGPIRLFDRHAEIQAAWRERAHALLVDEYQDTNLAQYELVRRLAGEGRGLTAVGDDDQSIYTWRGAHPENLRQLATDFADLKVIKLEQNYRSRGRILRAANALIANNPHLFEKRLWSEQPPGAPLRVLAARSEDHEAERVVAEIQFHRMKHATEFRDYAILFRSNYQAKVFERVLREYRIPYHLSGASSFFDRTEIKDVMSYLRLLCNADDDAAFLRVVNTPRREIGPATIEALATEAAVTGQSLLRAAAEPGLPARLSTRQLAMLRQFTDWLGEMNKRAQDAEPAKLVCDLLAELHYEEWLRETCNDAKIAERRMENILELVAWITKLARQAPATETSLANVVTSMTLFGLLEKGEDENTGDRVALMTLHSAKGLEFRHVYLVGLEEGLLPHHASLPSSENGGDTSDGTDTHADRVQHALQEERRLAYVGITRAQESLTFSYARQRKRAGEVVASKASRFLSELPNEDLDWETREAVVSPDSAERADIYLDSLRQMLRGSTI